MSRAALYVGDALDVLRTLPDESVQCCVTSPPYWGLRDYGVDGQLGLESDPQDYVSTIVDVFAEVRRVLAGDGTLWLNMGDSYACGGNGARDPERWPKQSRAEGFRSTHAKKNSGLKPKDLVMMPARVALALQADGWWVRSDTIWHKPNPMPESVRDRPTRSHEYVFLLSKARRYFYDADAIAEPLVTSGQPNTPDAIKSPHGQGFSRRAQKGKVPSGWDTRAGGHREKKGRYMRGNKERKHGVSDRDKNGTRNARSVWTISTTPYPGAHYATFPPELAERCILAGSRPGDTVLDPFGGSGTTAAVATGLGRNAIHIDLNPDLSLAIDRIGPMLVDVVAASAQ